VETKNNAYEYIKGKYSIKKPYRTQVSVHYEDKFRVEEAEKQARLAPAKIEDVIRFTNEFLVMIKMKSIDNPIIDYPNAKLAYPGFYDQIKKDKGLKDIRDIVWMKFTKDGFLGVVAVSNDINFDIPSFYHQYNYTLKGQKGCWIYNTSGIIIHMLGKEWDESFVLIFPLCDIPSDLKRGDVECGIGNYLISKSVPILDYYSHTF
jgi:hypothetical protein